VRSLTPAVLPLALALLVLILVGAGVIPLDWPH
jgi:hypothetical protein